MVRAGDDNDESTPFYRKSSFHAALALALFTAILSVILPRMFGAANGNGDQNNPEASAPGKVIDFTSSVGSLSTRDFVFTVLAVSCGKSRLSGRTSVRPKRGHFCIVTVNVANISGRELRVVPEATLFVGSDEYLMFVGSESSLYGEKVFPRTGLQGFLVFELPIGAQPTKLVLKDDSGMSATFVLVPK